jgi:hypothetical protein
MIDTRRTEILKLEKQLEREEAAAKAAGVPLQDLSVWRPDHILKANFERLGRLIAPKTREEILINRLDKLSGRLSDALAELDAVEKVLQSRAAEDKGSVEEERVSEVPASTVEKAPAPEPAEGVSSEPPVTEKELRARYETEKEMYETKLEKFESDFKRFLSAEGKDDIIKEWKKEESRISGEREKLIETRNKIEQELSIVYHKEAETIERLRSLIELKISKIDERLRTLRFKEGGKADQLREEKRRLKGMDQDLGTRIRVLRDKEMKVIEPLKAAHV